jgi:16S rRNA (cytosine967-C5)-methyltransferase
VTEIPGLPARRAALKLLDAVLRRGQALENALSAATQSLDNPADRGLCHAISSEVLRRLPDLDALIDSATKQRLPDDAKARMVLRIALTQALCLGTPAHAAIATALPLVEGGPKKLVHGVFGTLSRSGAQLREVPMLPDPVERRWDEAWGPMMIDSARRALAAPPPLDLSLCDQAQTAHWVEELRGTSLAPGHVRVGAESRITDLPGFAGGEWWVQNIAATLPARLLGSGGGRAVLDLCAAPGGKTMQLSSAGWQVTAVEKVVARTKRIEENLTRVGLEAEIITADILKWQPARRFEAILLDAPCTATGIFARHPDVLHRIRPSDIREMADLQGKLLARAAALLKPAGTLIYAACSLEPDEGEGIVAQAVTAAQVLGIRLDPICAEELAALDATLGVAPNAQGCLRVLPRIGVDGFFVARFRKA